MPVPRLLLPVLIGVNIFASAAQAGDDPPARVGRLNAVIGAVHYRAEGADWSSALVNEPILAGAGLNTGRRAEADLSIAGDRVALAAGGEARIVRLDRDFLQIAVLQGRIGIHLAKTDTARTVEIDLPRGGVWLTVPGDYDITAGDAQSPGRIAVYAGEAHFAGSGNDMTIAAGSTATLQGDALAATLAAATSDTFSTWWRGDGNDNDRAAVRHLALAITGAEALDANGVWASDPTYGDVWYPKDIADDWAPYRYGSWRFLPPFGWTWIDHAAWGFAPSHYGRWARIGERWAWVPGPQSDEPAYNPALVEFLGTAGIGLSYPGLLGPAVAWFPLAPGEAADDSTIHYQNRHFASIVARSVFTGQRPVPPGLLAELPERRLDDAPIVLGDLAIGPATRTAAMPPAPPVLEPQVAAHPEKPTATDSVKSRRVFLARIFDALKHATHKHLSPAASAATRHLRSAAAEPLASTTPTHPLHNHPHLAAARGGGQ
jgi:hypothetical protein